MKHLKIFLAMLDSAFALSLLVLILLDLRNPYMEFLTSGPSRALMAGLCLCTLATAWLYAADQRGE